jgi:hypothetical protein
MRQITATIWERVIGVPRIRSMDSCGCSLVTLVDEDGVSLDSVLKGDEKAGNLESLAGSLEARIAAD